MPKTTTTFDTSTPADDRFLIEARKRLPGYSDAELLAYAHEVCAGFDQDGVSISTLLNLASELPSSLSDREAGEYIGISAAVYCPQYVSDLERLANSAN